MSLTVKDETVDAEIVRTADEWAAVIKADLTRAVEGIVSAGRNLIQAKADVSHGEWLPMLQKIGISKQVAARLMEVGRNPVLANVPSSVHLPSSLDALYALSRLDPEVIEEGIANGDISSSTTIRDAREFARKSAAAPNPDKGRGKPLTDQFLAAMYELNRRTDSLVRLANDDRFPNHAPALRASHLADLQRARSSVDDLIISLTAEDGRTSPVAKRIQEISWLLDSESELLTDGELVQALGAAAFLYNLLRGESILRKGGEQGDEERRKREQAKKDHEDGLERGRSRVRTFLAGYDQAYSLAMGLVPDRDALLGGLSPKDRTRFERIESETTWPTARI